MRPPLHHDPAGRACARRGSPRFGRRGGARPTATAPFTPASDPLSLLWWDPTTPSGATASWVDKIAAVAATQGTGTAQPTQSNTAIGGAYPGVTSDGGDFLTAAGAAAILSGKTTITVIAAMVDAAATNATAIGNAASGAAAGGLFVIPNGGGAGTVAAVANGASGLTQRWVTEALATVKVVSAVLDYSIAGEGSVVALRVNGAAQALTNTSATSTAGSCANASIALFGRPGGGSLWAGTLGHVVFRNSAAQDAGLEALEDFIGAAAGLSF